MSWKTIKEAKMIKVFLVWMTIVGTLSNPATPLQDKVDIINNSNRKEVITRQVSDEYLDELAFNAQVNQYWV
jgi:hypothetical protein